MNKTSIGIICCVSLALGLACVSNAQAVGSTSGQAIVNNTPRFINNAKNLGPADPAQIIDVELWLSPHKRAELDTLVEELYDPTSSHYHNWLKPSDIVTRFAPTAEEAKTVGKFLSSHNLPVVDIGPDNFYVRARGTLADVQKAFRVQISNFEFKGKQYRANTSDPYVEGDAATLVSAIYGLDNMEYKHPIEAQKKPKQPQSGGD